MKHNAAQRLYCSHFLPMHWRGVTYIFCHHWTQEFPVWLPAHELLHSVTKHIIPPSYTLFWTVVFVYIFIEHSYYIKVCWSVQYFDQKLFETWPYVVIDGYWIWKHTYFPLIESGLSPGRKAFTWHSPDLDLPTWPSSDLPQRPNHKCQVRTFWPSPDMHLISPDIHLKFNWSTPDPHLTTWPSFDPYLTIT